MKLTLLSFVLILLGCGVSLFAQQKYERPAYETSSPYTPALYYSPQYLGGPLYVPPTAMPLPSELRNAIVNSGELPSTLRMNFEALGPLAPEGPLAYLKQWPPLKSTDITTGNFIDTRVNGWQLGVPTTQPSADGISNGARVLSPLGPIDRSLLANNTADLLRLAPPTHSRTPTTQPSSGSSSNVTRQAPIMPSDASDTLNPYRAKAPDIGAGRGS